MIESIIAAHPSGIGIKGIDAEMKQRRFKQLHRRTWQRRLQKLINDHRVITAGASIALVYKLRFISFEPVINAYTVAATAHAQTLLYVPVSPEGASVRN